MKTAVATDDDKEFFQMLRNPFTFDWVSTKGGEHRVIAQGIEWPGGAIDLHFPNLETLMEFEPSDVAIEWHGADSSDDPQPR